MNVSRYCAHSKIINEDTAKYALIKIWSAAVRDDSVLITSFQEGIQSSINNTHYNSVAKTLLVETVPEMNINKSRYNLI